MTVIPDPIPATLRHPVPVTVRPRRGARPLLGRLDGVTQVTVRGIEQGAFTPIVASYGLHEAPCLVAEGRLWRPLAAGEPGPPLPLGSSLALLAAGAPLPGSPLDMRAADALLAPGPPPPGEVPDADAAHAAASAQVRAFASDDLLHDGRYLYQAFALPLLYAESFPTWRSPDNWKFPKVPGLLPGRLGPDGQVPLDLPFGQSHLFRANLSTFALRMLDSLSGLDPGPVDLIEFANETPSGLLALLRRPGAPDLAGFEDRLWPLVLRGCVGGIRGDDLAPAIDAIGSAARALLESGRRSRALPAVASFVERVARPALAAMQPPMDREDATDLGALAP